jgi:4-amino-4-deoxy-L-arabinose transferase-like glycosyltransferase
MLRTRAVVLILMVCALSLIVGLGSTPLWDPDEPRFAAATRTMVVSGDVVSPSFNGKPRFEKPILFYWLQLPFFLALGPTETAARLPSALAGVGSVVLLYLIGQCVFNERAALFAALALATVFRFVAYARQGSRMFPRCSSRWRRFTVFCGPHWAVLVGRDIRCSAGRLSDCAR